MGVAKGEKRPIVSPERIYQHVWSDKKQGGSLHTHPRTRGKRYLKRGAAKDGRGIIVGRVDIDQPPAIVEKRKRFDDLEMDAIIGKYHKGAIVTVNDRATGLLHLRKVESKETHGVAKAAIAALRLWKHLLHTATSDNGKEFAQHQRIADKLQLAFYYAKPYHSWVRRSNENLNGLIRQYIPKKTDLRELTGEFIQYVEDELNNRPRKRFKFRSPLTTFERLTQ